MRLLLPIIIIFLMSLTSAYASSSLEVSTLSDFSTIDTDFGGGETIFIRMVSDLPLSAESKLNLRDNNYSLINTFDFNKEGNYFTATIPTPYEQGYYSLEGVINSGDSSSTSVKTIKVGDPISASIRVSIDGSEDSSNVQKESNQEEVTVEEDKQIASQSPEFFTAEDVVKGEKTTSFGQYFSSILNEIVNFIWPFKTP